MITGNNTAYSDLFAKANTLLKTIGKMREGEEITNLNDYFMYIEDLKNAIKEYENKPAPSGTFVDPLYLILPIEEDLFEINANTREIKIPDSFKRNGVGVVGDDLAEVLYFSIDRYFDLQDLFSDNIDIYVHWKNGKNEGLSLVVNKTLAKRNNCVVFGWPIVREITTDAGQVQFAVRFYTRYKNEATQKEKLVYSFSTLPNLIKINSTLTKDVDIEDEFRKIAVDRTDQYFANIKRSLATNIVNPASFPYFEEDAFEPIIPNGIIQQDLDETTNNLKLRAKIHFDDADENFGTVIYDWYHVVGGISNQILTDEDGIIRDEYLPTTDELRDVNDIYYTLNKDGQPEIYTDPLPTDPDEKAKILERYSTCLINKVGEYFVKATNIYGKGNETSNTSQKWIIPAPQQPQFDLYNMNLILDENNPEDSVIAIVPVMSPDGGKLSFQWLLGEIKEPITEIASTENGEIKLTIKEVGEYYLKAINSKNNASSEIISSKIRVTYPAMPVSNQNLKYLLNNNPIDAGDLDTTSATLGDTLEVFADEETMNLLRYDSIVYQWNKLVGSNSEVVSNESSSGDFIPTSTGVYTCTVTTIYNNNRATFKSEKFYVMA